MGSRAGAPATALTDREPPQLVGVGLPRPALQPAAGDAVAWRRDALDGPPARLVPAQPAGRRRPPRRSHDAGTEPGWPGRQRAPERSAAGEETLGARLRRRTAVAVPCCGDDRVGPDSRRAVKRRRANVLFVLMLTVVCTVFLAATTSSPAMIWVAVAAVVCLLGYVCMLGQLRQRDLQRELHDAKAAPRPAARQGPARATREEAAAYQREARSQSSVHRHDWHTGPVAASTGLRAGAPTAGRTPSEGRPPGTLSGARGCSSVGRAQQSHC